VNLISGVDFDPESKAATFSGDGGLILLMHLLLKAKFGEPFHGDIFLNPWVNALVREVDSVSDKPQPVKAAATAWGREFLLAMGREIALQGESAGFWAMTAGERKAFIRDVAAAPHRLSDTEVEIVLDAIDSTVWNADRLVRASRQEP